MKRPGMTISPRPSSEHFYLGLSYGKMSGIRSFIGPSNPVATSTITDLPSFVNNLLPNTQNIS